MTYCEYQAHSAKTQARLHFVLSIASAPGLPGRSDCHVRSSCSSRELPPSTSRVPPSPRGTPPLSLCGNIVWPSVPLHSLHLRLKLGLQNPSLHCAIDGTNVWGGTLVIQIENAPWGVTDKRRASEASSAPIRGERWSAPSELASAEEASERVVALAQRNPSHRSIRRGREDHRPRSSGKATTSFTASSRARM